MASDRLKKYAYHFCRLYTVFMSILFIVFEVFLWALYIFDGNIREYCIYVPATEPYHFRVSEHNACMIDWSYFINEPLFFSALIYTVLVGPVAVAGFILLKGNPALFSKSKENLSAKRG